MKKDNYSLYDESFNNMDCLLNKPFYEFFLSYQISDFSALPGEVNFYFIEKFENQQELLNIQEKCIIIILF